MKVNNPLFLSIVATVSVIACAGYLFLKYITLEEPLFFNHDYEQKVRILEGENLDAHGSQFELKYVTNTDEDKEVTLIEFPEEPEMAVQLSEYPFGISSNSAPGEQYGPYTIRTLYVKPLRVDGIEERDSVTVTQADFFFSDTSTMTVDIGEVTFYPETFDGSEEEFITDYGYYTNTEGYLEDYYEVSNAFTLTDLRPESLNKYGTQIDFKINDQPIEDIIGETFHPGELFDSASKIVKDQGEVDSILDQFTITKYQPELILTDANGQHHRSRLLELPNTEEINLFDLIKYAKAKGAI